MPKENESTYNAYPAHREYVDGDAEENTAGNADNGPGAVANSDLLKRNFKGGKIGLERARAVNPTGKTSSFNPKKGYGDYEGGK